MLLLQPPPRGCVLKLYYPQINFDKLRQPPPRGCVLKQEELNAFKEMLEAAASARLCVETLRSSRNINGLIQAAASARLYVETILTTIIAHPLLQPPPSGCVLKHQRPIFSLRDCQRPPLRGCVLKL